MIEDKPYERVMKRAFNLLSAKPRSIAEMRERLLEKVWAAPEAVERAIARLQELGYLDDRKYAEHFAQSKLITKPIGRSRLKMDLRRKKISATDADQAIAEVYTSEREEELIDSAIAKRLRLRGVPTTPAESKKLCDHLLRLGFKYDLVLRKIRTLSQLEVEIDD